VQAQGRVICLSPSCVTNLSEEEIKLDAIDCNCFFVNTWPVVPTIDDDDDDDDDVFTTLVCSYGIN